MAAKHVEQIALLPDIAIARVGSSAQPLACYDWSKEPDNSPDGSGKTTIEGRATLGISSKGEIELEPPTQRLGGTAVDFTEPIENGRKQRLRPVCPWFVLFVKWRDGGWEVLLPQDLEAIGVPLSGVSWEVVVASRKPYNMTLAPEDIVYAEAKIDGEQGDGYGTARKELIERPLVGVSDANYWIKHSRLPYDQIQFDDSKRLIPKGENRVYLGRIQAPHFSEKYGIRLRFVPPPGVVYGPINLWDRIESLVSKMSKEALNDLLEHWDNWFELKILRPDLKSKYCILNPNSAWMTKSIGPSQEVRTLPGPQFANIAIPDESDNSTYCSLGLIDDFSDGIVTVALKSHKGVIHTAQARIVIGPPDFAPDRRHPVRLYETFADRAYLGGRDSYAAPPSKLSDEELESEVQDLFRRAYETVGLTNVDAMNNRLASPFSEETKRVAPGDLPLTLLARDKHRRLASPEALADILREQPNRKGMRHVILDPGPDNDKEGLINLPPDDSGEVPKTNAFNRMPALLRGPQFDPLHLTKRQIAVLRRWVVQLRTNGPKGG
jgi:hypothetical protein